MKHAREWLRIELAARAQPFLPVAPESHRSLRSRMTMLLNNIQKNEN